MKPAIASCKFSNVKIKDEKRILNYFINNYQKLELKFEEQKYTIVHLIKKEMDAI